jgi:M6 family metalloprotease-like protein
MRYGFPGLCLSLLLLPLLSVWGQNPTGAKKDEPKSDKKADPLAGYKTVKDAIKADPAAFKTSAITAPVVPPFVGVGLMLNKSSVIIEDIIDDSPAATAGLKIGDTILTIAGKKITSVDAGRDQLRGATVGEKLPITIERDGKELEISVTPRPISKPFSATGSGPSPAARAILGVQSAAEALKDGGVEITSVTSGGAAEKAGLKEGDILMKVDDKTITESTSLRSILSEKKPGDVVKLLFTRKGKEQEVRATLQGEQSQGGRGIGGNRVVGWDDRLPSAWRKPTYKLAVIGIEYPDQKHNEKIKDSDWEESLFSLNKYTDKSATGSTVYGSMNDYFQEISYGTFKVEGKFAGWVEVSKKRMEYSTGNGVATREKTSLLSEAMDKLLAKDKDALKDFDGVFFLYAGDRVQTTRGGLYWPHRATLNHNGKRWPYFIVQEGGPRMTNISVFCHEFGHMLGLPDLYARPEVPGMEGVGVWCAMSQQNNNGRPQHFSAWSKEQLGWIKPTVIDPRVKQKLILAPINDAPTECFKVMIKQDGSEYFLLENRKKKGFDKDLPAEGLLIWRVIPGNRTQPVFLEEAHGVAGPSGPRLYAGAVPFPSPANTSFTPDTIPSSKSVTGGGLDVSITNIRRLPDGRIAFQIGYEYQ